MNSVFQSYSGRIPSLTGLNHKRGKSGQNEGLFKTTLEEEIVDVNSAVYNDDDDNEEHDDVVVDDVVDGGDTNITHNHQMIGAEEESK